jgi:hypothetical protein
MRTGVKSQTEEIVGARLGTSTQPPRATRSPTAQVSCQLTAPSIRPLVAHDIPGALRQGRRCSTACRPLPDSILQGSRQARRTL